MAKNLPELTHLSLNFAGAMTDESLYAIVENMKQLRSISLDGAYLVAKEAWVKLFERFGGQFKKVTVGSSVRVDETVIASISQHCPKLRYLCLKELPSVGNVALQHLCTLTELEHLEIYFPQEPCETILDAPVVDILNATGSTLRTLTIQGAIELGADTTVAIKASCHNLLTLDLSECESIPAAAVVDLFNGWQTNNTLTKLSLSRIMELDDEGLRAAIDHSWETLEELNISGTRVKRDIMEYIIERTLPRLQVLDIGFVRSVDDMILEGIASKSPDLVEVRMWGCPTVTPYTKINPNIRVIGREADFLRD